MEVKKTSFYAPSVMERATKLIICLIILLLLNSGKAFASSTEKYEFSSIINSFDFMSDSVKQNLINNESERFNNEIIENNYMTVIYAMQNGTDYIYFYFYNTNSAFVYNNTSNFSSWNPSTSYTCYRLTVSNGYRTSASDLNTPRMGTNNLIYGIFSETGFETNIYDSFNGVGTYGIMDTSKWTYIDGYSPILKQPYFEFTAKKIGTTTLENVDGNINTYYKSSFDGFVNSYTSNDEIGYLYIPPNYGFADVFFPKLFIFKNNLSQTQQWLYTGYDFFIQEQTTEYNKYIITIDQSIITAPYYYDILLQSVNEDFEDAHIRFVVINENISGPTIETPSGDIISGDAIKDETTIGDIQNDINEPYNPDKSILNQMNSGDILENMGYAPNTDPNADLWETIINGFKETLTGSGDVILEVPLRTKTIQINSKDIKQPNSTLKALTASVVNFWFLMQMFTFIKKSIDQINEGNLKVMHDVDADCYFF